LPRQTDDPETRDAPTDSELNPLLNPLLAENMGRWAEVYFTSSPEKREDAVRDLVRELRDQRALGESSGTPPSQEEIPSEAASATADTVMAEDRPLENQLVEDRRICASCGRDNPMSHTFCGMCGARMDAPATSEEIRQLDPVNATPSPNPIPPGVAQFAERSSETPRQATPKNTFLAREANPASGKKSSRIYLALVLLAVALTGTILTLAHRAQRTTQSTATPAKAALPVPLPAAKPSAPAASPAENSRANPASSPVSKPNPAPSKPRPGKPSAATPLKPPVEKIAPPVPAPAVSGNGSEELAVALGFLSGTAGHPRDRTQAMEWLWKAVGKQNTEAMLLLTDEYLRGEGTPKNCDQARVLLDAAARKGIKEAADRLRHLQSFGCQ
jgi:hypothetical protein